MKIQINDLKARWNSQETSLALSVSREIERSLEKGDFILGSAVRDLEEALCQKLKAPMVKTCASGSDALWLALVASGIGVGDEVVLPPVTFAATLQAILRIGATPVFADVNSETWTLDLESVENVLSEKTRAVIAVNIAGVPAELIDLFGLCQTRKIILIEDNAQGLGSQIEWHSTNQYCHLSTLSFFPTKNLGGIGDGGALVVGHDFIEICQQRLLAELTSEEKKADSFAEKLNLKPSVDWVREYLDTLCNQGINSKGELVYQGWNSRLDTIQAQALIQFLPELKNERNLRLSWRRKFEDFFEALGDDKTRFRLQRVSEGVDVYWSLMAVWVDQGRDELLQFLNEKGVGARVYYSPALHHQKLWQSRSNSKPQFEVAEKLVEGWFFLPFHAHLKEAEFELICELILEWRDTYVK